MKIKVFIIQCIFLILLTGCGTNLSEPSDSTSKIENTTSNNEKSELVRAIGRLTQGTILIIPAGKEEINQLGAPSSLGSETDYSFKGDYNIIFKDKEGKETDISKFSGEIIAHDKNPIQLEKLAFEGFEAVYFKPIPNVSRPESCYFYAVDKNSNAFQFSFLNENGFKGNTTPLSPNIKPTIDNNQLIVPTWNPEEDSYSLVFTPDLNKKIMKFHRKISHK